MSALNLHFTLKTQYTQEVHDRAMSNNTDRLEVNEYLNAIFSSSMSGGTSTPLSERTIRVVTELVRQESEKLHTPKANAPKPASRLNATVKAAACGALLVLGAYLVL